MNIPFATFRRLRRSNVPYFLLFLMPNSSAPAAFLALNKNWKLWYNAHYLII